MKHVFHYVLVAVFISAHWSALSISTANKTSEYVVPTRTRSTRTGERMLRGNDSATDISNEERGIRPLELSAPIQKSIRMADDAVVRFADVLYRNVIQKHPAVIHFSTIFPVNINRVTTRVQELRTHPATSKLNQETHILMALGGEYTNELPYISNGGRKRPQRELGNIMKEKEEIVKNWRTFFSDSGFPVNVMMRKMREFVGNSGGVDMGIEEFAYMAIGTVFFKANQAPFVFRELKPPIERFPYAALREWGNKHDVDPSQIRKELRVLEEGPNYRDKTNEDLLKIANKRVIADMLTAETHERKKQRLQ